MLLLKYINGADIMNSTELYRRPNIFLYRIAQGVSLVFAKFIFKRRFVRNELKDAEGPLVVIANHQAALDFVNIIGATSRPMSFVISNSFYNSLPVNGILNKLAVIPKQQFQTSVQDMKKIKSVIDNGEILVIYPAGLMCEDGISTPIPRATYKFLKWLGADVYVARTDGTYFVMPKWTSGMRSGETYMDIYKLFAKEELKDLKLSEIRSRTEEALLFDAYAEQEKHLVKYKGNSNLEGLENVLYECPECGTEFSIQVKDKSSLYCTDCGYKETADEYAFLHNTGYRGREIRHVSEWSRLIYSRLKERIEADLDYTLSADTKIHMIDFKKHKFSEVGFGKIKLCKKSFELSGIINGEELSLSVNPAGIPTLPFGPGKYLELQHGGDIYRCVLSDGRLVMKFINALKIFHELNNPEQLKTGGTA